VDASALAPRRAVLPLGPYELRISGLCAQWPDGEAVTLGADLLLPPGRRVALVAPGPLGGSALAAVLLHFLDYTGSVTLGGVEVRDLARDDVRTVVGLCARDAAVLPATAADNVLGASVSGAVRQRIAFARALLADVPILIVEDLPEALLAAAEDRTLLLVTHRPVVPGGAPVLRHVDEVVTLSGS
jgi:ABC-type transport system involved in cytochrome bd biosynthesis fused ATPase/permease subunit